jgi:TolB-like protein
MKILMAAALAAALAALAGCSANPAPDGRKTGSDDVYSQPGMEVSKVASQMADTLAQTLGADLQEQERQEADEKGNLRAKKPSYPRVAVTSFTDTDTYENAGSLGRQLGEFFIHELDRRGIPVVEFKTTGSITVSKDGEMVFSRDWKKLASKARIRHILAGTISRNERGVVLSGRIIDMSNSQVMGSATGFVPYKYLPYCYRTADKNCSFEGVISYSSYVPAGGKGTVRGARGTVIADTAAYSSSTASAGSSWYGAGASSSGLTYSGNNPRTGKSAIHETSEEREARQKIWHDQQFNEQYYPAGASTAATSTGNYEQFIHGHGSMSGKSSVIYPADTYRYQGRLVRDVHDQSQYQRIEDN